jgi:thymidylate synthase ThyX
MTITAVIITDSVSPAGIRLTTMQLRYPKMIHGEVMTHRMFSRNASSSRAIPVERLIKDVMDDPAMPVFWGKNQAGMQATEEMGYPDKQNAILRWLEARDQAVAEAWSLHYFGAHKQIVNRIIEPWCHINVVVTATNWANFFALRCHPAAQPEMRVLAEAMRDAMAASTPNSLRSYAWHLPYVTSSELDALGGMTAGEPYGDDWVPFIKLSVARCARVSYLTQDGKQPTVEADLALYDRLVGSTPLHASPAEHQAMPDTSRAHPEARYLPDVWDHEYQHGNLRGWRQYRKMLPNECAVE